LKLHIDLHIHSLNSGDSFISLDDAIRRCREEKLDGFAITDHDALTSVPSSKLRGQGIFAIRGMEVTALGAHILALDVSEPVQPGLSMEETVDRIHAQGGIAIVAHPYSILKTWVNSQEVEKAGFDAVEVANAAQFPYGYMLKRNTGLAERLELPQTGGSDAHIPRTIGRAYTIFEAETRDVEGALHALRDGDTEARGRGITLAERMKLVKN
jgi:predicted metal-dependent phosphoesterase TrpH